MRFEQIIYFGTPDFAVPTLEALCAAGRRPCLVVSQPDRPAGRGRTLRRPAVAERAEDLGLPVEQPTSVRDSGFLERVASLAPDLAVVVAFGQIFRAELLELPRHGCVNVHASLLPRHRGAGPVQAAIRAGDERTGVTTMMMDEGLDTGPILAALETPLSGTEMAGGLSARLAVLGAGLLLETLDSWEAGCIEPRPQPDDGATYAPRIVTADARVDWSSPASEIAALARAMTPWPGLWTEWRGERVKLRDVVVAPAADGTPGSIVDEYEGRLRVVCRDGSAVGIARLQRPGRRIVKADEFVRGTGSAELGQFT